MIKIRRRLKKIICEKKKLSSQIILLITQNNFLICVINFVGRRDFPINQNLKISLWVTALIFEVV